MAEGVGFSREVDAQGVLRVVFDRPGERVNLLDERLLRELGAVLDEVRRREEVRGVLFASAKPGMFLAGMDVEQIASVRDAYRSAEGARFGQAVFQKIADCGRPSACAINGVCLGGGAELALACSMRVAADDPSVRIGFPEVQIGIIPGFGGTQRLPRLIGLPAALELILTGSRIDARKARRLGLVDAVVPAEYLEREALALLRRAAEEGLGPVVARFGRPKSTLDGLLEHVPPLRGVVLDRARKRTARKVSARDYPAPFRAIEALELGAARPLAEGLDIEARIIGELVPTETSRNLIWLFRNQTALKSGDRVGASARRVDRMAIVGAGVMGGGIAQLAAAADVPVRLKDVRYEALLTALRTAHDAFARQASRGRLSSRELRQKMALISPTLDATGLVHADLVVEAVVESLEVKRAVVAEIERHLDSRAVFASNTSSLPISEIAARALHPERIVGLHFFNPVDRMPLVEIIAGRRSSPEAVATARSFALRLGKVPVLVRDTPGFLVNRILTRYLDEALHLLGEGLGIEPIDQAMRSFGMPMGPFELLDQIGLDTAQHVAAVLASASGAQAGATAGAVLGTLVQNGRLGRKSGRGFYRYHDGKRAPESELPRLLGLPGSRALPPETLQERLLLALIHSAVACLEQGVVETPRDVDLALVLGTGFPPFRGGPLRHADSVGIPIVADRLARLADAHGDRFRPAARLTQMVREQRQFHQD